MIDLKDLEGTWYVNRSNFPMWLKGGNTNPVFHYEVASVDNKMGLLDKISYRKDGQKRDIDGFDELIDSERKQFVWRGKGLMRFLKSKWEVVYIDKDCQWAIIHFKKTFFTPGGYDVISRYKNLNARMKQIISHKQEQLRVEALLTPIYQV